MSKLERYPAYKESGVEWLGEIPEHWILKTVKALFQERKEMNYPIKTNNILSLCMYRGVIPYSEKGNSGNRAKDDITAYKLAYPNDIVLNSMNVIAGSVGLSKYFGVVSPVYYMLHRRDKNDSIELLSYIFQTETFQKSLIGLGNGILVKKSESTGKLNTIRLRIPMSKLNQVNLPYPPQEEQTKIASFLDEKTSQIDKAISQKEKLIELLKERRQIVINEAVTKGLDKDVEFKDSGVEWIGEIPAHWTIEKGKRLFKQMKRPVREQDEIVTCFRDGEVTLRSNRRTDGFTNALKEHGYQGIRKGDFIIHNMDAFAGAIGISDSDGKSTPVYAVCRPWDENIVSSEYYARYLRNLALQDFILSLAKGIRERSTDFRFKEFGELEYPLPPKEEQIKIVEYIETQTAKIDQAIELQQNYIAKLKEYKASLIDSVVTGKVRVA